MTTIKTRELSRVLEEKGFSCREGSHKFYFLYTNGRKTSVRTKISHGIPEYGDPLLAQVRHQLSLTSPEFQDFIECPLTASGYVDLFVQKGRIRL